MSLKGDTAEIMKSCCCADCGWPLIHACVNDKFADFVEARNQTWDWWVYCSNKGCTNHEGQGVFDVWPEWIKQIDSKN